MPRIFRKTAILAKVETTYGTDAAPTGAADAILISNATFSYSYNNVNRDILRPYIGGSEQLVGTRSVQASFDVEISGSGVAGTAPAWGVLLRGCGFAETVTAASRVEYNPISASFDGLTIYYSVDGVQHKMLGCRGTVSLGMGEGERPLYKFTFTGIDGGVAAAVDPTLTLTTWKPPVVVTNQNSTGIKLGSAYAAGVLTGGTAYSSRGINIDVGNQVQYQPMLGSHTVEITNREMTGSCQLDLTAADTVTFMASINANALTTLSFEHGSAAGAKFIFFAPAVQRIDPTYQDYNGNVHFGMSLRFTPSAGNDEMRIVAL